MSTHEAEIKSGQRFEFGRNWADFLTTLTPERIEIAESLLKDMLRVDDRSGKRILDAGSGSGLFSLAARTVQARAFVYYKFDQQKFGEVDEAKGGGASIGVSGKLGTEGVNGNLQWVPFTGQTVISRNNFDGFIDVHVGGHVPFTVRVDLEVANVDEGQSAGNAAMEIAKKCVGYFPI